ncbi:carboxymethylenebutenolidase [Bryocella elongata]|uniref:Carboxymethylenebutenolidase n=1 Tax=Bryocella elongata TaxID=863522 RepID=A0A1H6AC86_9BACT|nr:dienelactone hydrolase family protein [Bryocella elongata]SEG45992.1 carboxymethylenebutenolidase [Bryocella elongata]
MTFRPRILPLTALLLATAAPLCHAQDWAKAALAKSPRHGEFVTIKEPGGRALEAWVVYPEIKDKAPVVVMIHEIFGMSDWARDMADELAGAGYIVVEPDLLSGFGPMAVAAPMASMPGMSADDHSHMAPASGGAAYAPASPGGTSAFPDQGSTTRAVSSLPDPQVLADLDAAADYGKKIAASNGKTYVAGFCWGGGKSFLFATHRKDLSGAFVFYGPPPATELMKNIAAPVYGFYAGNDARISATVPATEEAMKADGKKYEPKIYDGAGHGFMRAGEAPDASAANTAARQESFRRLVDLLGGVH